MTKEFDENMFYDLRYDVYFKAFFLNNKMLAGFLSLLWNTKVNPEDITYDNTEFVIPEGKKIIYDVVANVNLEMQNLYHKYLNDRMTYYAMRKYSDKLKMAEEFSNICIESIWFLGFDESKIQDTKKKNWLSEYMIKNNDGNILTDKFRINQIFLKNKDMCPITELLISLSYVILLDRHSLPEFSTDREEGLAEGKAEGIEEGIAKRIQEGENAKAISIAKKLFASGQTKEFISSITGLSLEELDSILK